MHGFEVLAEGFLYPEPARARLLQQPPGALPLAARPAWARFTSAVGRLSLAEWEELYTRTLDLNPVAGPYVGYQVYGEDYRRGALMARLSHELARLEVPSDDELPDHLAPVLRYLARSDSPLDEVVEATQKALKTMARQLFAIDRGNPYLLLVRATQAAVAELPAGRTLE